MMQLKMKSEKVGDLDLDPSVYSDDPQTKQDLKVIFPPPPKMEDFEPIKSNVRSNRLSSVSSFSKINVTSPETGSICSLRNAFFKLLIKICHIE